MRALLVGYGKMGKLIAQFAPEFNITVTAVVDPHPQTLPEHCLGGHAITEEALDRCDVVFDFSSPDNILSRIIQIAAAKKPLILGTTGWHAYEEEAKRALTHHESAILVSPNFSLGVALYLRLVDKAASLMSHFPQYDLGLNEIHHRQKLDAPSGTALAASKRLLKHYPQKQLVTKLSSSSPLAKDQVLLTSERYGYVPGEHTLVFDSLEDTISLTHSAKGRDGFAKGALACAFWLIDKKGWYTVDDMINEILQ